VGVLKKIRRFLALVEQVPEVSEPHKTDDPKLWITQFGSQELDENGHNQMQRNAVFLFRSAALHVTMCNLNGNPAAKQMSREDFHAVRLYCLDLGVDVSKIEYRGYRP